MAFAVAGVAFAALPSVPGSINLTTGSRHEAHNTKVVGDKAGAPAGQPQVRSDQAGQPTGNRNGTAENGSGPGAAGSSAVPGSKTGDKLGEVALDPLRNVNPGPGDSLQLGGTPIAPAPLGSVLNPSGSPQPLPDAPCIPSTETTVDLPSAGAGGTTAPVCVHAGTVLRLRLPSPEGQWSAPVSADDHVLSALPPAGIGDAAPTSVSFRAVGEGRTQLVVTGQGGTDSVGTTRPDASVDVVVVP